MRRCLLVLFTAVLFTLTTGVSLRCNTTDDDCAFLCFDD